MHTRIMNLTTASVLNIDDLHVHVCTRRVQELERNPLQGKILVNLENQRLSR